MPPKKQNKAKTAAKQHCNPGTSKASPFGQGQSKSAIKRRARRALNNPTGKRVASTQPPMSSNNAQARRVTGSDMIGSFTVTAPGSAGLKLAEFVMAPRSFENTRLAAESSLYSAWRPVNLSFTFVPSAGQFSGGQYSAGWCLDPSPRKVDLQSLSSFKPSKMSHISQVTTLNLPAQATRAWYSLDETADPEDYAHGVVYVLQAAPLNTFKTGDVISLSVHLSWTIDFRNPVLPSSNDPAASIYALSSYTPYFTDNGDSFEKLSIKHSEGGSLVPFPEAEPGTVYKLDTAAKLLYYKSATETAPVTHMVRITTRTDHSVAVFGNFADANKYAKSGDVNHCYTYYTQGPFVTPSNPAWKKTDSFQYTNRVFPSTDKDTLMDLVRDLQRQIAELKIRDGECSISARSSFSQLDYEKPKPKPSPGNM